MKSEVARRRLLGSISIICAGGGDAGPIGKLPKRERFDWLVAPRSTIIQTSAVHTADAINSLRRAVPGRESREKGTVLFFGEHELASDGTSHGAAFEWSGRAN